MFRAMISSIFRSTRLCVTVCDIMHRRCCRPPAGNMYMSHFTYVDLVLDEVNHADLVLSISAVKPISRILTIFSTSYSFASIGGSKNNPVQVPLQRTPSHIFIVSQSLHLSRNNSFLQFQLFCCWDVNERWSSLSVCLAEGSASTVHHMYSSLTNKCTFIIFTFSPCTLMTFIFKRPTRKQLF